MSAERVTVLQTLTIIGSLTLLMWLFSSSIKSDIRSDLSALESRLGEVEKGLSFLVAQDLDTRLQALDTRLRAVERGLDRISVSMGIAKR